MSILSIGIEQGRREALRQLVAKKLAKGKTPLQIADEIEEELPAVEQLIAEIQQREKD
ncbi:MAG: hypothetical protein Q4C73_05150 [Eubacteriales bacterium]|nr:hypothetical protein [Eubacteriales bacterium]